MHDLAVNPPLPETAGALTDLAVRRLPPKQQPYELALRLGFANLCAHPPSDETLAALGAHRHGDVISLPALHERLLVNPVSQWVTLANGDPVRAFWSLLAVHYLCANDVVPDTRVVSLNHFDDCRGYLAVFEKRIIGRFLATAGRKSEHFARISEQLHAARLPVAGMGYTFQVFPQLPIAIIRYDGDEEFPPGASVLYRADIRRLLPPEDRIVAAELLLDALSGKLLAEAPALPQ